MFALVSAWLGIRCSLIPGPSMTNAFRIRALTGKKGVPLATLHAGVKDSRRLFRKCLGTRFAPHHEARDRRPGLHGLGRWDLPQRTRCRIPNAALVRSLAPENLHACYTCFSSTARSLPSLRCF